MHWPGLQPSFALSNNLATLGGIPAAFALYDAEDNSWALDAGALHRIYRKNFSGLLTKGTASLR